MPDSDATQASGDLERRRVRHSSQLTERPLKKHKSDSFNTEETQSVPVTQPVSPPNSLRWVVEDNIRSRFPGLQVKSDLEALLLATSMEDIPLSQAEDWLAEAVKRLEVDLSTAEAQAVALMHMPAEVTGNKPRPEESDITFLPIPTSNVTIRVWPGSPSRSEYNVDFFDTETNTSIDIPSGYVLVLLQPRGTYLPPQRLMTLDETFRYKWPISQKSGASYVVRDDQTFALVRTDVAGEDAVVLKYTIPGRD